MKLILKIKYIFLFSLLIFQSFSFSQEVNIVPYLKEIDNGNKLNAMRNLVLLKDDHPNDPSVLFLEAVLTVNGQDAVPIYSKIVNEYSSSKYADASLFRLYSYYYALGLYNTANSYLNRLKKDYSDSPYIRKIENKNLIVKTPKKDKPIKSKVIPKRKKIVYKYTLQTGAFSIKSNAENLKETFDKAGFYSNIIEKNVAGTVFHIVFVGKFENEASAQKSLKIINKQFNLKARIAPIDK